MSNLANETVKNPVSKTKAGQNSHDRKRVVGIWIWDSPEATAPVDQALELEPLLTKTRSHVLMTAESSF